MLQFSVREFLREAAEFDIVLIDCPPNLYRCSWTALVASDYVLIPVPPEDFGTQGLRAVHQTIEQARKLNPGLRRLGHVISRSDRRLLIHRAYEQRVREIYRAKRSGHCCSGSHRLSKSHWPRAHRWSSTCPVPKPPS